MTRCFRSAFWPCFIFFITAAVGCTSNWVSQPTGEFRLQPAKEVRARVAKGRALYPDQKQNLREFFLAVGDGHHLRVEVSGNPDGIPLLYMHGGPGFPVGPVFRRMADPARYRLIQVDQRGAGTSYQEQKQPLYQNHTDALLEDFEKVRSALKVDRWLIMGGSWGSALALLYAERYPERVRGLILRGIYLARPQDTSGLYGPIAAAKYPELWRRFVSVAPEKDRADIIGTYLRMMTDGDQRSQQLVVQAADEYEGSLSHAKIQAIQLTPEATLSDLGGMTVEYHYIWHHMFLGPNEIFDHIDVIRRAPIPILIIQGRDDHIVSFAAARELARELPDAVLVELPDTGHSISEPRIQAALVAATDIFAGKNPRNSVSP